ncbi:hypothetical protein E4U21_003989 [Claviceps maximensis]|nr:hypothetical protein E4U21_003989 [Claviceps maximensis]
MTSDIASRIKARFTRRRGATFSSLPSPRSGPGERDSSSLTAPSQSSCEPFFLPPLPQLTPSQLSNDQSETASPGTASDTNDEALQLSGNKWKDRDKEKKERKNKKKNRFSRWHVSTGRLLSISSASACSENFLGLDGPHEMDDNEDEDEDENKNEDENNDDDDDDNDDNGYAAPPYMHAAAATAGAATPPRRFSIALSAVRGRLRGREQQQQLQGARGRSLPPAALLQHPRSAAPASSPAQQGAPALALASALASASASASRSHPHPHPHPHLHSRLRPLPHPHPSPPLPPRQHSSAHQRPLSQPTPLLALSPGSSKSAKSPKPATSKSPRRRLRTILVPRLRDTDPVSSRAIFPAVSTESSTDTREDLQAVDPLRRPHHGIDPDPLSFVSDPAAAFDLAAAAAAPASAPASPIPTPELPRRQSLFASRQTNLINTLLRSNQPPGAADTEPRLSIDTDMVTRKIWVRRPHASATTILINEDDLVDDVRDMILRKYANSLGRTFDSPDLNIRLQPRDQTKERILGPDEVMAHTLDVVFPGGQTVDEALVIEIPRKFPKASPRASTIPGMTTYYITEDGRPSEAGEGYFPPVVAIPSPHPPHSLPTVPNGTAPHSIAVLGTGHIPPIPSPGGGRTRMLRERPDRPRAGRTHTSSPTTPLNQNPATQPSTAGNHGTQNFVPRLPHSRTHSSSSDRPVVSSVATGLPNAKANLPKSPAPEATPAKIATPPPRSSSPRPRRSKKGSEHSTPTNMLNGSVPPINVLIVEDNPINLKLLEAFVKRLKVRWQTAMNGRDAVTKWRTGGYHLVLMDIQLPVMNGLDATREIRRLERVNSIGVFSSTSECNEDGTADNELKEPDRLQNQSLFKSPVIIVALTASSLQSDRHEALAAGCNDFLTKPVNFVWLERKVMEWGCMQALIDFDGWRKWKEAYSQQNEEREAVKKKAQAAKAKSRKVRSTLGDAS